MTAPEPLADQLARRDAHRRHVRRSRVLLALLVLVIAGAGAVWPPLLVGLAWLAAYCVVMAVCWHALNRLAKRRRPLVLIRLPEHRRDRRR